MNKPLVTTTDKTKGIAALGTGKSVLGKLEPRIPISGRIRPGIMVLTQAAAKNPKAVELYKEGYRQRMPFKDLARKIQQACGFDRSPMTPKNVSFFLVRPSDFKDPNMAAAIFKLYATEGPEYGKQLYRFPIIFPLDNWLGNMPHEFACFTAAERKYWSVYDIAGNRKCMMHAPVKMHGQGKAARAQRLEGGRPIIPRPDNNGMCYPDICPEYQTKACTLTGRLVFYIPGISGSGAIELPNRSFYAMQEARLQMEMVAHITGGKISGTYRGKPLFWISKKLTDISMIDPQTGQAKRVKQWIIGLDADIDMTHLFQHQESFVALQHGQQAAAALGQHEHETEIEYDYLESEPVMESAPINTGHGSTATSTIQSPPSIPTIEPESDSIAGELVDDEPPVAAQDAPPQSAEPEPTITDIETAILQAIDIESVNATLDLVRNNPNVDHDNAKRLHKMAEQRVKNIAY